MNKQGEKINIRERNVLRNKDLSVYKLLLFLLDNNKRLSLKNMTKKLGFRSMTSLQRSLLKLEKLGLAKRIRYQQFSWTAVRIGWLICPCCERVIDFNGDTVKP